MDPWEILEMEPSDDLRQVKRAYAKKLKQTRPDEKPAEFQALHQAYKRALSLAERAQVVELADSTFDGGEELVEVAVTAPETKAEPIKTEPIIEAPPKAEIMSDESETVELPDTLATVDNVDEPAPRVQAPEIDEEYQVRLAAFFEALNQVDRVLENDRFISVESSWHFLAKIPFLLEDDFNRDLGFQVFKRIAEQNMRGKDNPLVTVNILDYCDSIFGWQARRWSYYREFGQELCDKVFTPLEQYSKQDDPLSALRGGAKLVKRKAKKVIEEVDTYYFAGLFSRTLALTLDLFIIYCALYITVGAVMLKLMDRDETEVNLLMLLLTLFGYFIMAWIMESSPRQATPGKDLFGFKVTNRQFQRVGYLHGFARILTFMLSLALTKFAWFVNCFLGGNLIHDRISRTYVIDVRKSQKEHNRQG